jgi:PBP1b-binding outer membrane lipoprotein LpoB
MKKLKIYILAIATFLLFFAGCIVNIGVDQSVTVPDQPSLVKLISVALLSAYEVVIRLIPTVGDYSAVSWIIKILKRVSDTLNVRAPD